MSQMAFKRMYVDLPNGVHERLKDEAASRGMSMKALVADLIEKACQKKPAKKKAKAKTKRKGRR